MSVGQKLAMLKMRSTSITFLSLRNLEAAPEEAMQLRRLTKSSNESVGSYLFVKLEFWKDLTVYFFLFLNLKLNNWYCHKTHSFLRNIYAVLLILYPGTRNPIAGIAIFSKL